MTTTQSSTTRRPTEGALDVTILLPCRNEAETVALCTQLAVSWMAHRRLNGEVLVVDNASSDSSVAAALAAGARVIHESRVGYGNALRTGIRAAKGHVVIMADADNTYDLSNLDAFYDPIASIRDHDMVVGDRFHSPPDPAAMSWLHRTGNTVLSALTRTATGADVRDVHCGMRSFARTSMSELPVWSTGMEFATHMLTHANRLQLRIAQTPVTLHAPIAGRRSHLRPLRDGQRHHAAIISETSPRRRSPAARATISG